MTQNRKAAIISISTIIGLVMLFFWYTITGSGNLMHGNNLDVYAPQWAYQKLMLREGLLPLWNPYTYSGTPYHADVQTLYFYPLQYVTLFLPLAASLGWSAILHFWIAGIGMWLYLRMLKLSNPAATFGSLAFIFSGFMVTYVQVIIISNSAAWLPWVMLGSLMAWRKNDLRWTIPAGVAYALGFLAGHTQIFYYIGMLLAMESIYRLAAFRKPLRAVAIPFSIALLSIALSAIQFLPTAQLARYSPRQNGIGMEIAQIGHLTWRHFSTLVNPMALGPDKRVANAGKPHETSMSGYVGWTALILALFAIIHAITVNFAPHAPRKRATGAEEQKSSHPIVFYAIVALFSLMAALGPLTPLYGLLYNYMPFFSVFRAPAKITFLSGFSIAVLSAIGADKLNAVLPIRLPGNITIFSNRRIVESLLLGILIVELWSHGIDYNYRPKNPSVPNLPTRAAFKAMGEYTGKTRLLTPSPVQNYSMINRVENIGGYSILFIKDYFDLVQPILSLKALHSPMTNFLNVGFVKAFTKDSPYKAKLLKNDYALPRFYIAHDYILDNALDNPKAFLYSKKIPSRRNRGFKQSAGICACKTAGNRQRR